MLGMSSDGNRHKPVCNVGQITQVAKGTNVNGQDRAVTWDKRYSPVSTAGVLF